MIFRRRFFLKIVARKHIYEAKRVLRSGKMKTLMRQNNSCCLQKKRASSPHLS